jgi:hypothetical protein
MMLCLAAQNRPLPGVRPRDVGLLTAFDQAILDYAAADNLIIVSADRLTCDDQGALLRANLATVADDLEAGAVVTIARGRMPIRALGVHLITRLPPPPGITNSKGRGAARFRYYAQPVGLAPRTLPSRGCIMARGSRGRRCAAGDRY